MTVPLSGRLGLDASLHYHFRDKWVEPHLGMAWKFLPDNSLLQPRASAGVSIFTSESGIGGPMLTLGLGLSAPASSQLALAVDVRAGLGSIDSRTAFSLQFVAGPELHF